MSGPVRVEQGVLSVGRRRVPLGEGPPEVGLRVVSPSFKRSALVLVAGTVGVLPALQHLSSRSEGGFSPLHAAIFLASAAVFGAMYRLVFAGESYRVVVRSGRTEREVLRTADGRQAERLRADIEHALLGERAAQVSPRAPSPR